MPSLQRKNARAENRFLKDLQELCRDKKIPPSIRLKALDRIGIVLGKFPNTVIKPVEEDLEPTNKRPTDVGVQDKVGDMMRELKKKVEESDANPIHSVEGS